MQPVVESELRLPPGVNARGQPGEISSPRRDRRLRLPAEGRWQVSIAGGFQPRWRGDGRELYYLDPRGNVMAAEVAAGERFSSRPPRQLFATGIDNPSPYVPDYAVAPDGSRFLLRLPAEGHRPPELKLVLGWRALLRDGPGPVPR